MEGDFELQKKIEQRSGSNRFYLFMYTAVLRFKMALKRLRVFGVNNEAAVVLPELILFLKFMFFHFSVLVCGIYKWSVLCKVF